MNQLIILQIIFFIWFVLAYILGYLNGKKKDIKEFTDETGQIIRIEAKKLITPKIPTGRIKPITPQEAYKRSISPERQEAKEAMRETLDNIPDLVAAKELAEAMRKEEYGK